MGSKVWLFVFVALLLVSSVSAAIYDQPDEDGIDAAFVTQSTTGNMVGVRIIVLQNCSLVGVQKVSTTNPDDVGYMRVRDMVTGNISRSSDYIGDNVTFNSYPLIAGREYRVYEGNANHNPLTYTASVYPPPQNGTYISFFGGCYGSVNCEEVVATAYGSVLKIYVEVEAPDEPPTYSNIWITAPPIYLGENYTVGVKWTDDVQLDFITVYENQTATGTWDKVGLTGTEYYWNVSTSSAGFFADILNWRKPGNKTIMWNFTATDTGTNTNSTYNILVNVTDKYPVAIGYYGLNKTAPIYLDTGISFYEFFREDSNLTWYNMTIYNSSGVFWTKLTDIKACVVLNRYCKNSEGYGAKVNNTGSFAWKVCMNDSSNQWSCGALHNFTVIGANPGWYDYGSNATDEKIYSGGHVVLFSNWTVSAGSLTNFSLRERYDNGTWYLDNATPWTPFVCGDYSDCAAEVISAGSMEPIGNHTFVFVANSSQDGFNQTLGFNISVWEDLLLKDPDDTFFGSDLFQETTEGNFSYIPTETASRGITALTIPPVMRDITGDGLDEIFFLDGNELEIYAGTDLSIVNIETLVGENFHRFVLVPNWTANYSVLALTEDRGNIILNNLEITDAGSTFNLVTTNITDWFVGYRGGELLMGCGNESCVVAYTQINYSIWDGATPNATTGLYVLGFHRDLESYNTLFLQNNTANGGICFSRYKNLEVIDYDGDGKEEAIFASMSINNPADDELVSVYYLESTISGVTKEHRMNITMGNPVRFSGGDGTIKCYDDGINHSYTGANRFFTDILVFNSGVNTTSLETHIGVSKDDYDTPAADYDWKIVLWGNDWSVQDVNPIGDNGIMSNLVKTGNHSFCGWGFQPNPNDQMLCGMNSSDLSTHVYNVNEFDLTYQYDWSDTLYSTNFVIDVPDWVIRNAIYYYDGDLEPLVNWSYGYSVPVPVISEGGVDLIITTPTTMYYYDDGYVEQPAQVDWWKVDPCIYDINGYETYWENETIVMVWVNVSDGDPFNLDNVSLRFILYNGTAHEQISIWTDGDAPIVQFVINTSVNYTTQNATLYDTFIIQVNDTGNKTIVNASFNYRVNTSNIIATVEYGDCQWAMGGYIYNGTAQEEELVNNTFIQGVRDAGEMAGFTGNAIKVFWILIMAFIAFILWIKVGAENPQLASGLIIGVELILLFIGYYFNLIPGFILFVIILIGFIIGGMFFKKRIMDS